MTVSAKQNPEPLTIVVRAKDLEDNDWVVGLGLIHQVDGRGPIMATFGDGVVLYGPNDLVEVQMEDFGDLEQVMENYPDPE